ncbi:MAG: flagellar basal body rod protein FlgB [Candidatus Cloacimonadota bacterium]|nr:MAG: flagellar basal body rod protein FlgB [Candidatus Cloacimonadota bacterium]PIE77692.1 MAG: flagellar basal body rod protein FlgB [Candidatus Delongbacteria bacterium]
MKLKDFLLNNTQLPTVRSSLNAYSLRQRSIADNIANVETPEFKKTKVNFEELFMEALKEKNSPLVKTDEKHLPEKLKALNVDAKVEEVKDDNYSNGINSVNLEEEMANLAINQIKFEAMSKLAKKQFSLLKSAISGR